MVRRVIVAVLIAACGKGGASKSIDDAPVRNDAPTDPSALAARFDKSCAGGDLEACRNLGVMYSEGTGVSADPRRATSLFAKACDGGNMRACNHFALVLAEGIGSERDLPRAIDVYQRACDGGYKL